MDIGTTSVKVVAADGDGEVVARTRRTHNLLASHAGERPGTLPFGALRILEVGLALAEIGRAHV